MVIEHKVSLANPGATLIAVTLTMPLSQWTAVRDQIQRLRDGAFGDPRGRELPWEIGRVLEAVNRAIAKGLGEFGSTVGLERTADDAQEKG